MSIEEIRREIKIHIGSSASNYRENLASQIIRYRIPISRLMDLLLEEPPISTRFSWLLGDVIIQSPEKSKEILVECYKRLNHIRIKNFDRTLSKLIFTCGENLPEELEGELVNKLFEWLNDTKITVSTKNNSLFALENLCKKYPELREELVEMIYIQKDLSTKDFKRRAEKVLKRLENRT